MSTRSAARPWLGAYLVQGTDTRGPWAYVGKGDPVRAYQSMHGHNGQTVTILAAGVSHAEAFAIECATMTALRAAGVRLKNKAGGRGARRLAPAAVLAAQLNNTVGVRRKLTSTEVGVALEVPTNLIHGHIVGDVRRSVYRQWPVSAAVVTQLRRLLREGHRVRVLAVAPSDVVVESYLLQAIKTFPTGHPAAGRRYFTLVEDQDAEQFRGHQPPETRQSGVRYLTPGGSGIDAFLSLP